MFEMLAMVLIYVCIIASLQRDIKDHRARRCFLCSRNASQIVKVLMTTTEMSTGFLRCLQMVIFCDLFTVSIIIIMWLRALDRA